mgnify:CR=1 FL=1
MLQLPRQVDSAVNRSRRDTIWVQMAARVTAPLFRLKSWLRTLFAAALLMAAASPAAATQTYTVTISDMNIATVAAGVTGVGASCGK